MADDEPRGKRRIVGFTLVGSAVVMFVITPASCIAAFSDVGLCRRRADGAVLSIVAVFVIVLLATCFIVSDPS